MSQARANAFNTWKHPNTTQDDYRTPQYLLDFIGETFGEITRDGACHDSNGVAHSFDVFGSEELGPKDTLFINPPWETKEVVRFVSAASRQVDNGAKVVFLLPNKLCEVAWCSNVNDYFENIILLGGRVDFSGPFSVKGGASRYGTFIGVMGKGRDHVTYIESINIRDLKSKYKKEDNQ